MSRPKAAADEAGETVVQAGATRSDADLMRQLRDGLLSGGLLRKGRLIAERELAASLAVSRTRLRRALDRMEQDGVIFRRQGQGTYLRPPPPTHAPRLRGLVASVNAEQIMEARLAIEPALAAFAAERATARGLERLRSSLVETQAWVSLEGYERADDIFHYEIAQMAANPLFLSIFEEIRAVRRTANWTRAGEAALHSRIVAETSSQHVEIWSAISDRNSEAARASMYRHLLLVSDARRTGLL